jgi:hypothetical protein
MPMPFIDHVVFLSIFMLSFIFFNSMWSYMSLFLLCLLVLPSVIQLSSGDSINRFHLTTFTFCTCMSQARAWISNVLCRDPFYAKWFEARGNCSYCWCWWNCYRHYLNFLFITVHLDLDCAYILQWLLFNAKMSSFLATS